MGIYWSGTPAQGWLQRPLGVIPKASNPSLFQQTATFLFQHQKVVQEECLTYQSLNSQFHLYIKGYIIYYNN